MSLSRKGGLMRSDGRSYGATDSEAPPQTGSVKYSDSVVNGQEKVDPIKKLKKQVSEVKGILRDDVEKAIARGEKVHDLDDRAEILAHNSTQFKDNAITLRKETQRRNWKLICCLIVVVVVVLGVIALIVLYALKII